MTTEQRKLSPYCLACKRRHTEAEMREYIERKVKRGKDPLAAPKGGFLCSACLWQVLVDMGEDDDGEGTGR